MAAHAQIEKTFLEGGETLVSVMDVVNAMIANLDRYSSSLDREQASEMVQGLQEATTKITDLPSAAGMREKGFRAIEARSSAAVDQVHAMHEIFRYLKVFAVTVKITGAGLHEFHDFANEIQERIASGATEIDNFSRELFTMRGELQMACVVAEEISQELTSAVPVLADNLSRNAGLMAEEHKASAVLAGQVKAIASDVQAKIARTLSALQIGDITRQRIEHVVTSLEYLDEFLTSAPGSALSEGEQRTIRQSLFALVQAQLDAMLGDFREKCASIHSTINSFTTDVAQMLSLREELSGSCRNPEGSSFARMTRDISAAIELTRKVEVRSKQSADLAGSVAKSVSALISSIETVRAIKTDIHYMALNSNLRCSRLGDAGRAVNVVSGELRSFAVGLEGPAEAVVESMHQIVDASRDLTSSSGTHAIDLGAPLERAQVLVASASEQLERAAEALDESGHAVFDRISGAIRSMDFERRLGQVMEECADVAASMVATDNASRCGDFAMDLSNRIYAIYTMAEEREIHARFLPVSAASDSAQVRTEAVDDDSDFLDEALF
jgi:methyl-accepting chemotaxis protein